MRRFVLATCAFATSAGCGFDKLPDLILDAPPHADAAPDAVMLTGPHSHYIADKVFVPTTNTQARDFGLDLDNDGTIDNQLGMVLSTFAGMGFPIQQANDQTVAEGQLLQLVDVQTPDFANAPLAGLLTRFADKATVTPPACNSGESYDPVTMANCKHHLTGNGSFTLDASTPNDPPLVGPVTNGVFSGGPGTASIQIAVVGAQAIQLNLIGARFKASGLSATLAPSSTADSIIVGGGVTQDDLDNKFIPDLQMQLAAIIARDCNGEVLPPSCGCMDPSEGKNVIGLFDTNQDCMVTVDEVKNNNLIVSLLAPDLTIGGTLALSVGVKLSVVNATFTVPGQ